MCWALVIRDSVLFLLGVGLIVKELLSHNPSVEVLTVGASLTGVPGWLHGRHMRHTADGPESSASTRVLPDQSSQQPNSSESEG